MTERLSLGPVRTAIWVGFAGMFLLFGTGFVLSGFILPPSAEDSSAQIVKIYVEHQTRIRVGCFLMITGFCFVALWGCALAALTRLLEGRTPIRTYTQVVCIGVVTVIVVFVPMIWALAAFRPGEIDPDVTRSINDFAWFLFLYPWPPLMIWLGVTGWTILGDQSAHPIFPRWSGYLCWWTALLSVPGGLISFFKSGPFSWNGVLAYWLPLAVFFVWVVGMSTVMMSAIKRLDGSAASEMAIVAAEPEPQPARRVD
ncbi:hypothetical protein GCM10023321_13860 [Pseudonocardia eucalypti]|uniref:DUF4328 domain-containing protein n=1 Tax=Pseudonocardia eucalypti TaxID=648755 RepID=A0ABP9PP72_9PSEU|nr:hypothetical protein [Pseudonocardia eucalypti]